METEGDELLTDDESVELAAASLTGVWPLALHAASVLSSPLAMPTTTYRIVKVTLLRNSQ